MPLLGSFLYQIQYYLWKNTYVQVKPSDLVEKVELLEAYPALCSMCPNERRQDETEQIVSLCD